MKLKDRIKTYNFWVSLSSAVFLLIKLLGHQFGFTVDESIFSDLITSLCGILVILGIIAPPTTKSNNPVETKSNTLTSLTNDNSCINRESVAPIEENQNTEESECDANENLNKIIFNSNNNVLFDDLESFDEEIMISINNQDINEIQSTSNIEDLKIQVMQNLNNQQELLNNNSELYIELLQNQINILRNR